MPDSLAARAEGVKDDQIGGDQCRSEPRGLQPWAWGAKVQGCLSRYSSRRSVRLGCQPAFEVPIRGETGCWQAGRTLV